MWRGVGRSLIRKAYFKLERKAALAQLCHLYPVRRGIRFSSRLVLAFAKAKNCFSCVTLIRESKSARRCSSLCTACADCLDLPQRKVLNGVVPFASCGPHLAVSVHCVGRNAHDCGILLGSGLILNLRQTLPPSSQLWSCHSQSYRWHSALRP